MNSNISKSFTVKIILLFILYSIIYFVFTYPTIWNFSSELIGKNDAYVVLWNTYIFETGIQSGKIWTTHQSFYPWGTSLILHGSTPFIGLVSLLFNNKILLFNSFIYVMFILSAIGGFWLSKYFLKNSYFAIICGFIFAFSPYKMARIEEHYPLVFTALIPFVLLFFIKAFSFKNLDLIPKISSKKYLILLILTGLLGFIIDYTICFQMIYLCALFLMFFYISVSLKKINKWSQWTIVISSIIIIHSIISFLLHHGNDGNGAFWWSGKWTDFIIPYNARIYPHLGSKLLDYYSVQNQLIESDMFLGYSLLFAFIISIIFYFKLNNIDKNIKALFFTLCMLVAIVMPTIRLPFSFTFYPPTAILHFLPVIKNLRCPTRFINDIMLVMPIIIFYVLEQISITKQIKFVLATILFIAVFIEYFPARYSYINYNSVPKIYSELAKKSGESVLVYPLGLRDGMKLEGKFDIETMQYQTVYRKKTMGGYISRLDDWMWFVHYQNAFTNTLIQLEKDSLYSIPNADYQKALKELKLDYVVIPQKYRNEKAAVFLQSTINSNMIQKEEINGDLLITLKR